jgi:hypothetical protein
MTPGGMDARGLRVSQICYPTRDSFPVPDPTRPDPTRPDPTRPAGLPVTRKHHYTLGSHVMHGPTEKSYIVGL